MSFVPQIKIPATYMRGGTSKGVFFKLDDLPEKAQVAGQARDQLLLRVVVAQTLMENKLMEWVERPRVPVKPLFSPKVHSQIMMSTICLGRFQLIKLL